MGTVLNAVHDFLSLCKHQLYVLTVGGHEETSVDLLGVTEVRLDLVAAGIKPSPMDAAGFDVQHVEAALSTTRSKTKSLYNCTLFFTRVTIR